MQRWLTTISQAVSRLVRPLRRWQPCFFANRKQIELAEDDNIRYYAEIPLAAVKSLFDQLPVDEASFTMVSATAHDDARAYFLYGAASEVMKAGTALVRWIGFLGIGDEPTAEDEIRLRSKRMVLESVLDEQLLWQRKLIEWLANLICFAMTNDQHYYRLFLAAEKYEGLAGDYQDLEQYYDCESANHRAAIGRVCARIHSELAAVQDLKIWFLKERKHVLKRLLQFKPVICESAYARLETAMSRGNAVERTCLGISYANGFGRASRSVHPSITYPTPPASLAHIKREIMHVSLLCWCIILRAHELAGIPLLGAAEGMSVIYEDGAIDPPLGRHSLDHQVGDLVLAQGHLAEIVEKRCSKYGLQSYGVRFLVRSPLPEIAEDCVPAFDTYRLFRKSWSRDQVCKWLSMLPVGREALPEVDHLSDDELFSLVRGYYTELEKAGILLDLIRRQGT